MFSAFITVPKDQEAGRKYTQKPKNPVIVSWRNAETRRFFSSFLKIKISTLSNRQNGATDPSLGSALQFSELLLFPEHSASENSGPSGTLFRTQQRMEMAVGKQNEASDCSTYRLGRCTSQLLRYEIKYCWVMVTAAYLGVFEMRMEKYTSETL